MALGHTKSSPSQKWLSVLEFCTAVSYHKVQFPVFCIKRGNAFLLVQGEWLTPILYQQFATVGNWKLGQLFIKSRGSQEKVKRSQEKAYNQPKLCSRSLVIGGNFTDNHLQ